MLYEGKSISEWSKETGIKASTISCRLKKGWSLYDAVNTPVNVHEINRKHHIVGNVYTDRFGNEFIVETQLNTQKGEAPMYHVRFLKSGYETNAACSQIISKTKRVQDRLSPSVFGVGIMGYSHREDSPKLYDVWRAMIARCYNPKNPSYKTYGGKGITVCDRWKRFDCFLEDVISLPGYDLEKINKGKLVLDKDCVDRTKLIYSSDTCCFITRSENTKESSLRMWNERKV